jgi:uncharacterized protein (DUF3084 family)
MAQNRRSRKRMMSCRRTSLILAMFWLSSASVASFAQSQDPDSAQRQSQVDNSAKTLEQLQAQAVALDQELAADRQRLAAAEQAIQQQRAQLEQTALPVAQTAPPTTADAVLAKHFPIAAKRWLPLAVGYLALIAFATWLLPRLRR